MFSKVLNESLIVRKIIVHLLSSLHVTRLTGAVFRIIDGWQGGACFKKLGYHLRSAAISYNVLV